MLVPDHLHRTNVHVRSRWTGKQQNQFSVIKPGWARSCSLQAARVMLCLSLCPTETSTTPQASQPGTPMGTLVLCPRTHLTWHQNNVINTFWDLSFNYFEKGVFIYCESQFLSAPTFQLPGEHHLSSPTAGQALSIYVLLLQAEQPHTHPLFLP